MGDGIVAIMALDIPRGLLQESMNMLIAGLGGGLIAWGVRKKYHERSDRFSKLEKTHRAMFGVEGVETMEGVVKVIEAHEEDIEEIFTRLEEGKEERDRIERQVNSLVDRVSNRKRNQDENEE